MTGMAMIVALAGLALGVVIGILVQRVRGTSATTELEKRVADQSARLQERELQLRESETRRKALATADVERAALASTLDSERKAAAEKIALLEQADARLRESFQALCADALRHNNESFLQLAQSSFGELHKVSAAQLEARQQSIAEMMAPIREALDKVDGKIQQVELSRVGSYEALMEQVRSMALTQKELDGRTKTLVDALRSPVVRGRWGEIQLKRVCEMAGMMDHCDFVEQPSVDTADGKLRPDLTVKLPGGKILVVDAKTPLKAYLDAMEAPDDATRDQLLREHARHVREHMKSLCQKAYWGQFDETPEFVVMFLPGETFFSAALQHDPGLIEYGVEQKVIPASPTTLIALLRSVAYGWQQDRIAKNAAAISELGRELYDRIRKYAEHHANLKKHLERAVEAYNSSVGSLEKNVLPQARRFRDLGATTAVELPEAGAVETGLRTLEAPDVVVPAKVVQLLPHESPEVIS